MSNIVLKIDSIEKSFGGLKAVRDFSLFVNKGEILGMIGPNGSGKTTIFNIISGFLKPDRGKIFLNGTDITKLSPHIRADLGIGRLFQDVRIFKKLTVIENVLLAYKGHNIENLFPPFFKIKKIKNEKKKLTEEALKWLEFVGLKDKKDTIAENLSFGQQKILALATILSSNPEITLLDEPLSGLDPEMKNKILNLILELKELGKTIIVIEHLLDFVFDMSDRVILLNNGKKVYDGSPEGLKENHLLMDIFTGNHAE